MTHIIGLELSEPLPYLNKTVYSDLAIHSYEHAFKGTVLKKDDAKMMLIAKKRAMFGPF
jgi:hypothetical protein